MDFFVDRCFALLGRIFFPRRQEWEQRRNAKILFGVIAFSVVLGLVVAKVIKMIYFKTKA
jgi:hypothetical protein